MHSFATINDMQEIYSQEELDNACRILKIEDKDKQKLKTIIEHAAHRYINNFVPSNPPLSDSKKRKKLEQLTNHLHKSKELYKELIEPENRVNFLGGFQNCNSDFEKEFSLLYDQYYKDMVIDSRLIEGVLDVLENVAKKAWNSDIFFQYTDNTQTKAVFFWVCSVTNFTEELVDFHFAEGTYNNLLQKHNSPATRLFELLSKPINKLVPTKQMITDSLIKTALKMYRIDKKNSSNI